ncbi:MAG: ABC transporter substrate-binding protein [Acidimicrobiales bacterium]
MPNDLSIAPGGATPTPRRHRNTSRSTDRRTGRQVLAALVALLALLAAACSGGESTVEGGEGGTETGGGGDDVLRLAFWTDMQVPDPDIFYEIEGNQVVLSTYEGLLRYKPDEPGAATTANEIEPWLAESYEISDDGLTYTFKLRQGVNFVDGTPMDAEAVKFSFERRTKVNSSPAYMLAEVASYETPDPATFVVKLTTPVSAFLDYLAAPYGPKVVSPALINANESNGDAAQDWIKTNSAGTGPYRLTEFSLGQRYVLTRNDGYWGGQAFFREIVINIVPDAATQQLQLEGGDIDILHQVPSSTTAEFRGKEGFQVVDFPVLFKTMIWVDPNRGAFKDKAVRVALREAIDRETLIPQVFGEDAVISEQLYPVGEVPEGTASDAYEYKGLEPLKALVSKLPEADRTILLGYTTGSTNDQRLTESIQAMLTEAGFDVTIKSDVLATVFDYVNQPDTRPNVYVGTVNPDAAHPDTWARIFHATGGALNYLGASVPEADALIDEGLAAVDRDEMLEKYAQAADLWVEDATFITLADVRDVFIAGPDISGFAHKSPAPFTLEAFNLTRKAA